MNIFFDHQFSNEPPMLLVGAQLQGLLPNGNANLLAGVVS